jgi:hypothetical protein
MLQIISGKFFNSPELSKSEGYNIFYSNYSWIIEVDTCIATIIPFFEKKGDPAYIIRYINQIEKDPVLVRTGDEAIVQQFESLCIFGFQAIFDSEKNTIERLCRPSKGGIHSIRPSSYVPRYFDPHIHGDLQDTIQFSKFIKKVIGLPRKKYNSVINCTIAFSNSLKLVDYNFDLAYSMLIYCLESLSQKNDGYIPIWKDYQKSDEIDQILINVDPEASDKIRNTILKDQHLKLQKRFVNFIMKNISDSFFIEESRNIKWPIRRSEIEQALINAYSMRSSYAHELEPVLQHLKHPTIAEGDVYHHDNSPYFTYSGLIRLTHHVIKSYIFEQEYFEKEEYNWHSELPNVLMMKAASKYWIWRTDGWDISDAKIRLSGFLSEYVNAVINHESMTDCTALMELYELKIPQISGDNQVTIVIHYCLYNLNLPKEKQSKFFLDLKDDPKILKLLQLCKIDILTFLLLTNQEWVNDLDECIKVYKKYSKQKFSSKSLVLPKIIEILLLVKIANELFNRGNFAGYYEWSNFAYLESTGESSLQDLFKSRFAEGELIDFDSVNSLIFSSKLQT